MPRDGTSITAAAAPPRRRKRALRDRVLAKADVLVGIGRGCFSRGVLLVKAKDGKPVVVGIGY